VNHVRAGLGDENAGDLGDDIARVAVSAMFGQDT
jgi:hypothetical protein